jgi:hypothetical protein
VSNPYVRHVGYVMDFDGRTLKVGVDYDTVTLGEYRLASGHLEELARLLAAASWEAALQHTAALEDGTGSHG